MKTVERFTMNADRLACLVTPGISEQEVRAVLLETDWPNADEHQMWLDTAPLAEIADFTWGIIRSMQEDVEE